MLNSLNTMRQLYEAYFLTYSFAVLSNAFLLNKPQSQQQTAKYEHDRRYGRIKAVTHRLFWYVSAILATSGSSGFGVTRRPITPSNTLAIRVEGFHSPSLRRERQIDPWSSMLGWYTVVRNLKRGGVKG